MISADKPKVDPAFLANAMASFVQIGALALLILWCYSIVKPFVSVVVWGTIIAIALYPAHGALMKKLGGSEKLSVIILVLAGLAIIIIPTWGLAGSAIDGFKFVAAELHDGTVNIPPPAESVAEWPVIGGRVYEVWTDLATTFEETMNQFAPQLRSMSQAAVSFAGSLAGSVFQFIFATIIGGALLTQAAGGLQAAKNISSRLVGAERGERLVSLSILTIRSVVKGVLGVAIIQALLAGIGLVVIGAPAAGLFAGVVLVLAIVQLPALIVLGPIAFWYFSVADAVPATVFLVYAVVVGMLDAFLKPLLLGRGLETPMLVILIGAIGGAITEGIVGLFVGSVVLSLAYEIFTAWAAPDVAAGTGVDA